MFSPPKSTVLLLIPHMGGGGSERVIETLARYLNPAKYDIHLGLVTASQRQPLNFSSAVSVHELNSTRVRRGAFTLLRLVWQLRPDLILSGIAHLNLLVLALRPFLPRSTRIIVRQNGTLTATLATHSQFLSRPAYALTYRRADRVICQSESMASEINRGLAVKPSKLVVLPNPTDLRHFRANPPRYPESLPTAITLLSIGRLVPEKGFDILLNAFASLSFPSHSAKLIIVGTGPEHSRLQLQAEALGITDRVHFTGYVSEPIVRFRYASLFVLSSRTEGLPNAMLEAAAAGIPIVATPASRGIVELLENREGVWLAPEISPRALGAALKTALGSISPSTRFPHAWVEPYDLSCSIPAYEAVIDQAIAGTA